MIESTRSHSFIRMPQRTIPIASLMVPKAVVVNPKDQGSVEAGSALPVPTTMLAIRVTSARMSPTVARTIPTVRGLDGSR